MKFRKKPVVIEATQWFKNGDHPLDYSKTHDGFSGGELVTFSAEYRKQMQWKATSCATTERQMLTVKQCANTAETSCTTTAGLTRWKAATLFAQETGSSPE